ncbi:Putative transcription initiation factor TFIID 111 kDa subunit AltName: Full=TAFII-111; AltName: Full=TBP-associated factor 111 kDa [Serendipita indica DSM 11827]|uniref:Related to TAF1-TFIID subunit (TBP-associated factor), 145 kD n=1 Tax=Serendipita indica (strain DSM 11827) TaxID=1109443 RepID=G4TB72_SERID|nr:Putative transcription initiation factor TFIID 111 kDa subunit AltName: Full=TAFII-111; AltName: Full=TBP-associated factor 111 kDa [Serendipita indica DSM 11827]CCA68556.1 related to TAF1-TFIID subunit (TBP-associated factor), 145 kD [Serendipita indica DSM 11827]
MAQHTESDFTGGMLGLDEVLRDVGVDASGLQQLGIQTGPRLTAQTGAGYMDDEPMSDDELVESAPRKGASYSTAITAPMMTSNIVQAPAKKTKIVKTKRLIERKKTVYEIFPSFTPDRPLDFVDLFGQRAKKPSRIWARDVPPIQEVFLPQKRNYQGGVVRALVTETKKEKEKKRVQKVVTEASLDADLAKAIELRAGIVKPDIDMDDRSFDMINLSTWEDSIMFDPKTLPKTRPAFRPSLTTPTNSTLESGVWTQSILWDSKTPFRDFTQIDLSYLEDAYEDEVQRPEPRMRKRFRNEAGQAIAKDKFNLSNDHTYEVAKETKLVRQTFGALEVEHAYPALKLQLPFYKIRLTKQECRSFHRPALHFPINQEIKFQKVKTAPKLKDKSGRKLGKGGDFGEGLRKTGDLTLKDTSKFVLWEYSEEHPPTISNFGMGSMLVNYYRKKDEKDEHIPKREFGTPFVLQPSDDTPFLKLGSVAPGQTVPALYNNMIRAPIFEHKASPTDFLVVRSTVAGESKYYIREIKHLFVLGQTIPVTEIPGPHSRKITTTAKSRLQQICYRLLRRSEEERIRIMQLPKYFPDQDETQLKQRLKAHLQEFMEYQRKGPHQGFWRLKPNLTIPDESTIVKMVKPEDVVLTESMQVGQQQLLDAGYSADTNEADDEQATIVKAKDGTPLTITQQLAPWMTTKNVLQAAQHKAMLKLYGEGDPTGRGEAFSYLKVSMKDVFVREGEKKPGKGEMNKSGHRYNVQEQQKVYAQEKERIWQAQMRSLSRKDPPELTDEEDERPALRARYGSVIGTPAADSAASPSPSHSSLPRAGSQQPGDKMGHRILVIRREKNGVLQKPEVVRDQVVIAAYLRKKEQMKSMDLSADALAPTGDQKTDEKRAKDLESQIAKLKRNQERRIDRKNKKIAKEGGELLVAAPNVKSETTRKCGNCGDVGHMKTNRKCPKWAEFNKANQAEKAQTTPVVHNFTPGIDPSLSGTYFPQAPTPVLPPPRPSQAGPSFPQPLRRPAPAPGPMAPPPLPAFAPAASSPLASNPAYTASQAYGDDGDGDSSMQ